MVWEYVAKRRWWLGEEMYGVWSWGSQTRRKTKEDPERGCQRGLSNTSTVTTDCSKWRKLIEDVRWSGWVWVGECFFWYWPTRVVLHKRPLSSCVCVCVCVCIVHRCCGMLLMLYRSTWCATEQQRSARADTEMSWSLSRVKASCLPEASRCTNVDLVGRIVSWECGQLLQMK